MTVSINITEALAAANDRYAAQNPSSKAYFEESARHLPGGNTRSTLFASPFPIQIVGGKGCRITSADGEEYLDMLGEYTAGVYGHTDENIIKAVTSAMQNGFNLGATSPLEGKLAQLLKTRFEAGAGLELMRFTNSGTEANLLAVSAARAYTGRSHVLVFQNSYHGSLQSFRGSSNKLNIPGDYVVAKYNSVSSVKELLSTFDPEKQLAAILVEPMQGAGGSFPASISFLRYLREIATQLGAILIHDEVMTSRLFYDGGLSGKYQIRPDMITMGKYLGGGMSFGLFGGRKDIMQLFDPRRENISILLQSKNGSNGTNGNAVRFSLGHSGTFNNNIMTLSAGIAGFKILTRTTLEEMNALGDHLRISVAQILLDHRIISDNYPSVSESPDIDSVPRGRMWISGLGSINTIHFGVMDEESDLRNLFYLHMLENKVYLAQRGFLVLTIKHTMSDVMVFVAAVEKFVIRWEKELRME